MGKIVKKKRVLICFGLILVIAGVALYLLLFPGTMFLVKMMDSSNANEISDVEELEIKSGKRVISARLYSPKSEFDKTIVLIHGVHHDGYNEQRLIHFTKVLVKMGFRVLTPNIESLRSYDIDEQAVDDIKKASLWMLNKSGKIKQNEKVGLWGISFAGGLCLKLAGDEQLKNRVSSSFSFGGHGNLDSTIDYLMTGQLPIGYLSPHVYGQAVLVKRFASKLVPDNQVDSLVNVIMEYLKGNYKSARSWSKSLPYESRVLTVYIFKKDAKTLGKVLKKAIGKPSTADVLSATKGSVPLCSIHLLHGSKDNVIPASELSLLKKWAESSGKEPYVLNSSLINHVELESKTDEWQLVEYYEIIRFWTILIQNA